MHKLKSRIKIERDYGDEGTARKVIEAVQPDNCEAPPGTIISMGTNNGALIIEVSSTSPLNSFLRTVDDLLLCIQAAEGAIKGSHAAGRSSKS